MIQLLSTTSSVFLLLTTITLRTHSFQPLFDTTRITRIQHRCIARKSVDTSSSPRNEASTYNNFQYLRTHGGSLRARHEDSNDDDASQYSSYPVTKTSLPTIVTTPLVSSSTSTATAVLSPWEDWCIRKLETQYDQALRIKCPFFKRRAADILDAADMILRFLVIRHKSLLPPPAGWSIRDGTDVASNTKLMNLPIDDIVEILKYDWRTDTNKGYYITGRITKSIFRDDCFFDGPDPDMPVRGLRKYLNAASQLFEHKSSSAQLLSIGVVDNNSKDTREQPAPKAIICTWKMSGVLRLPWKPVVPEIHGRTIYYLDENNLIYLHIESWEESTFQAFLQTFWPEMANQIQWNKKSSQSLSQKDLYHQDLEKNGAATKGNL